MKPYYQDESCTIYHGDCREILPTLPKVDLVLTSPPYDNLRDYKGYTFDFESTAKLLSQRIMDGGIIVWIVGDQTIDGSETGTSFRQCLFFRDELGLNLHDTMIYMKDACPFPETNRYYPAFEYMFLLSKGKPKTTNLIADKINSQQGSSLKSSTQREPDGHTRKINGAKYGRTVNYKSIRQNVWKYSCGYNKTTKDTFAFEHPAMFPERLAIDHIVSWSNPGETVIDPFLGSGTTTKVCKLTGRKAIGIEIEEKYCEIAAKRLEQEVLPIWDERTDR